MYLDRQQLIEEVKLRNFIKRAIKVRAANKEQPHIWEEFEIRSIIRKLIKESTPEKAQHRSTGINVLEDLLKKIIPVIETDYKMLTTDVEQRKSFSAHIITAVENSLAPISATQDAGDEKFIGIDEIENVNEIEVEIGGDEEKFIDIEDKPESEEEEEGNFQDIDNEDRTGANFASATFDKIETQITDAFALLSDEEDQKLFEDYLITNLKLYFDKFEDELATTISEPTTPEYEEEKDSEGEEELETGEEELEL
jgi:hypothetical protein